MIDAWDSEKPALKSNLFIFLFSGYYSLSILLIMSAATSETAENNAMGYHGIADVSILVVFISLALLLTILRRIDSNLFRRSISARLVRYTSVVLSYPILILLISWLSPKFGYSCTAGADCVKHPFWLAVVFHALVIGIVSESLMSPLLPDFSYRNNSSNKNIKEKIQFHVSNTWRHYQILLSGSVAILFGLLIPLYSGVFDVSDLGLYSFVQVLLAPILGISIVSVFVVLKLRRCEKKYYEMCD